MGHAGTRAAASGKAVHVDPIKPMLKAPGTIRLILEYDELLSTSAFKFNLRRYILESALAANREHFAGIMARRCRLTVSKPVLKAPMASALDTIT